MAQFGHVDDKERKQDWRRCSYQTAQDNHGDGQKKKSKTREDGSYHTAQIGLGDRGRNKKRIGLD